MRRSPLFAAFLLIASITVQAREAAGIKAFGKYDLLPGTGIRAAFAHLLKTPC